MMRAQVCHALARSGRWTNESTSIVLPPIHNSNPITGCLQIQPHRILMPKKKKTVTTADAAETTSQGDSVPASMVAAKEHRKFKMHPDLLYSVIRNQAGSIGKAVLELV